MKKNMEKKIICVLTQISAYDIITMRGSLNELKIKNLFGSFFLF